MSTIAELTVPADEFALRRVFETVDDVEVEIERVVAYEPNHVMPFVWFSGDPDDLDRLEGELADDPSVEDAQLLTDLDDECLFRMRWVNDVTMLVHMLTVEDATILNAVSDGRYWRLRILFPERTSLSETYDFATKEGLTLEISKVHELDDQRGGRYGLTDAQHETLVRALEHGYYEIPRDIDMESLAEELGISHQALSERLRRAHQMLVEEAVSIGPESDDAL